MPTIVGTNGNDWVRVEIDWDDYRPFILFGLEGDDILNGWQGDDTLIGGPGADEMYGGPLFTSGVDTASYQDALSFVVADFLFPHSNQGDATGDSYHQIDNLKGSNFDDGLGGDNNVNVLTGDGGNDFLVGRGGADHLFGGAGDDRLDGGAGADLLSGGIGIDAVDYSNASSSVNLDLDTGGALGEAAGDIYDGIESAVGSRFNDRLYGTAAANELYGMGGDDFMRGEGGDDRLFGGGGDDLLFGDAGADLMQGGAGWDRYFVDDAGDVVDEAAAGSNGLDIVQSSISFSLANPLAALGAIEDLTLTGDADIDGTGNDLNNTIFGNNGDNVLSGGGGDDKLFGGEGDDALNGGLGADVLEGGNGADDFNGSNGDDQLFGQGGDDLMVGGAGADDFDGGAGVDWVYFTNSDGAVSVNLTFNTASGFHAAGDTFASVENLHGSSFGDVLAGDSLANTLNGAQGSDTLSGGGGADVLMGGLGDDWLNGGPGDDVLSGYLGADTFVYNLAGFGKDTIIGFENGIDKFDLNAGLTFADFTETAAGSGTRLTLIADPANTILILGVAPGLIDAGDFV